MSATPSPTAAPESATAALYRAALGPVNAAHYLAVFDRFDHAGRASPVWNPAAGLLTLNWMVFRQLWGAALVYLACAQGAALLVLVLARRFLQWPPSVEWGVLLALLLLSIALPGAYGTALLHAETRRRMTRAVREARTVREACATLEKQASSRRRWWVLVVINLLLAAAAVAVYLEWRPASTAPAAAVLSEAPQPAPAEVAVVPGPAAVEPEPAVQPVAATVPAPPDPVPEPPPVIVSPPVLPPATVVEAASPPAPTPAAPSPPARATLVDLPSLPAPSRPPAKAAVPPKTPVPATAPVPQAHGINVGLFADPANAEKAHARLVEAGFPAILQKVESASGERTRVRVGPFAGRAQADEAAARIRAMGLDAVVFAP